MGERVRHLDPTVEIKGGDTGVVMTTTETTIREESFIDPQHAVHETQGRSWYAFIKNSAAGILLFAGVGFGAYGGYQLLNSDLPNNDVTGQQRDIEAMLLGTAGVVAIKGAYLRSDTEMRIGDKQAQKAGELLASTLSDADEHNPKAVRKA